MQKSKNYLNALLLTSALAWVNAAVALWHRQGILANGLSGTSFCKIGDAFDCDAAALSKFSSFLGIPTSVWGMVAYTLVFMLTLLAFFHLNDVKKNFLQGLGRVLFFLSTASLVPTLVLALLSFAYVKTICLMCVFSYILNILLFVFSLLFNKSLEEKDATPPPFIAVLKNMGTSFWMVFGVAAALQLLSPIIIDKNLGAGPSSSMEELYINDHFSGKQHNFNLERSPSEGAASAPITIVEFSDMQCPSCARSALTLPPLLKSYGDKVRVVYKNFPLDSSCNSGMKSPMHPFACLAAKTGVCVYQSKGAASFFNFKHHLFSDQAKINPEFIKQTALKFGLDQATLETCINNPATHQFVVDDVAEGTNVKVNGTPALYINGRYLQSGPQPRILKRVLDKYLN